ncbi:TniQ family protein [Maritalea mobilis]|uniref:TniQ family protein n=1 Tax=Maritalea mobilis TaxID=483324 RepID=UPI001C98596C|nr:TniQ family protein [Maritalea mobilis]MBY6203222.1 TniQ family protein [Maritalea mobilis]
MSFLPISSPRPAPRETLFSYLARLAATWQTEAPDLAYDMGASFKRLLDQDEDALEILADWAQLEPDLLEELLSWTGVRTGEVRMEFRGEVFVSRALRNPVMRGCPICLREDALRANGSGTTAMVMRGDWLFREVTLCIEHGHPLVPLWTATAVKDRFDIGARLRELEHDIMSGALDQACVTPSAYDLWLDQRLEKGTDGTWFREHSVFAVTTFLKGLGEAMARRGTAGQHSSPDNPHALGFDAAVYGPEAARRVLDQIAATTTGYLDEPSGVFRRLYSNLARDYLDEEAFAPFRQILRDCILAHWPIGPGEVVLGECLEERRLHSLTTAAAETGMGVLVLEHFLTEAGALIPNDPKPANRRLFDAQAYAALLSEIPTLVGPIAMRNAMGATRQELSALAEDGLLVPRTRVKKVKNPWRISDGVALVEDLSANAVPVGETDKDWETLLLARNRRNVSLIELIGAVREKRLQVGQRVGVEGFHGIVVAKVEVDRVVPPQKTTLDVVLDEAPGTVSAAEFGRSVGLRDGGAFLALIEAGHVPAQAIEHPRTGRPQYRMNPEHIEAFHRRFVTLTTLSAETGKHRNTLKGLFKSEGIKPFAPDGQDYGPVYLREHFESLQE